MPDFEHLSPGTLSRRECLRWLARAGAGSIVAGRVANCRAEDQHGMVKIFELSKTRPGMSYEVEKPNSILSRGNEGVACMSITCTHKGTKLDVDKDGAISCAMHGSTYDLSGKPTSGPAPDPLPWYATEVDKDGNISADISKPVKQGEWAKIPESAEKK